MFFKTRHLCSRMDFRHIGFIIFKLLASAALVYLGYSGVLTFMASLSMDLGIESLFVSAIGMFALLALIMAIQLHFRPITGLLKLSLGVFLVGLFIPLFYSTIVIVSKGGSWYIESFLIFMSTMLVPIGLAYGVNKLTLRQANTA